MHQIHKVITKDEINCIRQDLLKSRNLYMDDSFPLKAPFKRKLKWLRPHEICSNPQFIVDGISRFDVNQGALGNCWFMAAIDTLTQHKHLFQRVVCDSNNIFTDSSYCGLFHFKFWHFGAWVDILIDDRLPTENGKLVFVHSNSSNEFWPSLIEKAYAKLYGGYANLVGGFINEAFSDLTGGVTETYDLKKPPTNFYNMILKAFKRNTLMGCSKMKDTGSIGIPYDHAYSITDVNRVMDKYHNVIELLRIRNPWGDDHEYTGPWSDKSEKWHKVSDQEKSRIGLNASGDGEFWMSFDDFLFHFDCLDICNLTPDMITREPYIGREWKVITFKEATTKSSKNIHEFLATDPDPDDNEDYCTIVVALMHISSDRKNRKQLGLKISSENDKNFVKIMGPDQHHRREKVLRLDVLPGLYKIEINSYDSQDHFEYMFRIFYETKKINSIYPSIFTVSQLMCSKAPKKKVKHSKKVKQIKYYTQKERSNACSIM